MLHNAVIVGGSIHMGKHGDHVRNFVERNRAVLDRLPSALFSVSLAASGDLENAHAYVDNSTRKTGWHPAQVGLFAAPLCTQYGLIKGYMMKPSSGAFGRVAQQFAVPAGRTLGGVSQAAAA